MIAKPDKITQSLNNMATLPKKIFRAYDIRGLADKYLSSNNVFKIGQSIGSQLHELGEHSILLGRDGRLSSPRIAEALAAGLRSTSCQVIDLGQIPTPVLYFAIRHLNIANGVVVTGSHNPAEYNGIKIVMQNACLHTNGITALYDRIQANQLIKGKQSTCQAVDIIPEYITAVTAEIALKRRLRIALDCGNGATSLLAVSLFESLGCEVHPLYADLDGRFPNHSPDPTQPKNLHDLQTLVKSKNLDIGIAFDGDGDRMIAVDNHGNILWPDRIMAILAKHILKTHPNRLVAFDVKCSQLLPQFIQQAGGIPSMCVSGHSLLKAHMKEHQAIMGGEFSGHIVLNDRNWSYADDGLYVAARLLELIAESAQTTAELFAKLPDSYSTPEYKLYFDSYEAAQSAMQKLIKQSHWQGAELSLIDGIRVDFPDCWGLARASNTTPTITLRFEAQSTERLEYIQALFRLNLSQLALAITKYDGFELYRNLPLAS